jgi:serine/threonine-protein kinase
MGVPAGTRFGPYEIAEAIGAGGMGEVYRARDTNLKRDVAIKVLPESFVNDASRLARFQREAEVLASLNHANIAQIYGLERSEGTTALVIELVEGPTLADRIAQGALPPNEALNVALQIAAALEAAHEQGIVHRDLKPANVKLKPDGTVKVLDFGIAKALETRIVSGPQAPQLTTPAMTAAGLVLGTAAYMAPEQARGKAVDKRADIWAFGCVLYEMLTGQPAFGGEDVPITLARVLANDTNMGSLPTSISPAVRHTLKLCLEKDPRKRIADIRDVRLALEGRFESDAPAERGTEATRPLWRRALPAAAGVVLGALLAGGYMWSATRPAPPPPEAPLPVTRFVITPPETARLTNLGGYDVILSPDGERIAYFGMNPQSGGAALYVRELDSLEARLIPGTETSGPTNMNPFFSPDGKWIGLRIQGRGILRVSVDGAPSLEVAPDPQPAFLSGAWGADDTIIYSAGTHLQRVSAGGGGTPEPVTPEPEGGTGPVFPAPVLLPGERAVLFGVVEGDSERVAVLDLETGEQKILVDGGQNPFYASTGHLVFARGTTLMAAPFSVAELAVTGEPVAVLPGVRHPGGNTAADYSLSATGTLVYVPGGDEDTVGREIVWVDRDGRVTERAIAEPVENARDPRLSPDGTRLVLTTGVGNDGDVWVYDLGGRPPIPLAVVGDNRQAIWSPDSTQVAFGRAFTTSANLYTTRSDGSVLDPQPLRPDLTGVPAVWSSAGELLLLNPRAGTPDILATPATAEGEVRDVVVTDDAELDPALTPNGRWLAYVSNRTGVLEVWVKGYPDGVPVRVSRNGGYEPRWSADGSELFYLQGTAMIAVPVETEGEFSFGTPTQLFSEPYFTQQGAFTRSYDVARDGRFLMIQLPGTGDAAVVSSIVVVENWTEELKQRVPTGN